MNRYQARAHRPARPHTGALLLAGAALCAALLQLPRLPGPEIPVLVKRFGTFHAGGRIPGPRLPPGRSHAWNSWGGDPESHGTIVFEMTEPPRAIGFHVAGFPQLGSNGFELRSLATGEAIGLGVDNVGERWRFVWFDVPARLRGGPLALVVRDASGGPAGWVAVTQPRQLPAIVALWHPSLNKLTVLALAWCLLALLASAAGVGWRRVGTGDVLVLPLSLGAVAAAGYAAFWLYFAHPWAGEAAAWILFGLAAAIVTRPRTRAEVDSLWRQPDWRTPMALILVAGLFYLAVLLLFGGELALSALAQRRFVDQLAADNALPHLFADRLLRGVSPRRLLGDWLSSDRPPLQTGWQLLLSAPLRRLGLEDLDVVTQAAGVWFQLMWVPAVWAWLRTSAVPVSAALVVIAALVPTGVLLVNSVFVWPKLGAGALLLTAFVLWFHHDTRRQARAYVLAGSAAALALLAHGAPALALLALAPLVLLRLRLTGLLPWLLSAATLLAWVAPWLAYQRFYEPPGNRLLKWHLAGVREVDDPRGTLQTIADAYRGLTLRQWYAGRRTNLLAFADGRWRELLRFDFREREERRWNEVFWLLFSFGWWNVGWAAVAARWLISRSGGPALPRGVALALAWAASSALVEAIFLFESPGTYIHQGSYTVVLVPLVACGLALWRLHPVALAIVAALQWASFAGVWLPRAAAFSEGHLDTPAALVAGAGALALLAMGLRAACRRGDVRRPATVRAAAHLPSET